MGRGKSGLRRALDPFVKDGRHMVIVCDGKCHRKQTCLESGVRYNVPDAGLGVNGERAVQETTGGT